MSKPQVALRSATDPHHRHGASLQINKPQPRDCLPPALVPIHTHGMLEGGGGGGSTQSSIPLAGQRGRERGVGVDSLVGGEIDDLPEAPGGRGGGVTCS